jgi:hypothetical protein
MTYSHGVSVSEQATSIVPAASVDAGLPVVVGCAPIHFLDADGPVNVPKLIYSYKDAVSTFGYSSDFAKWNLCEFMYAMFALFSVSPVVFVNVFDPDEHQTDVDDEVVSLDGDEGVVAHYGIISGTLVVKDSTKTTTYVEDTDYTVDRSTGEITLISGGSIAEDANLSVSYTYGDPSQVTTDDIIGGIDGTTGASTGLELVDSVFPMFGLVPGQIVSPGYSVNSGVAAVMHAKAGNINGHFKCIALVDIDSDTVTKYDEVSAEKNSNNLTDNQLVVCWPKVALDGKEFWLSSQLAALICQTDSDNNDVPYVSPSNKSLQMDSAVANGDEVWLGPDSAAYLNGQGIVTALNFYGGWVAWGNRTGCYPATTDVKDAFIPIRRMFNWIANTIILTYWQKVDAPINRRLIETIVDSLNIWLNGLAARQYILGGRVEFQEDENAVTDLMDGIITFHVYVTPPSPAREIEFVLEYDPDYIETLFG